MLLLFAMPLQTLCWKSAYFSIKLVGGESEDKCAFEGCRIGLSVVYILISVDLVGACDVFCLAS